MSLLPIDKATSDKASEAARKELLRLKKVHRQAEEIGIKVAPFKEWVKDGKYHDTIKEMAALAEKRVMEAEFGAEQNLANRILPYVHEVDMDSTWDLVKAQLQRKEPYTLGVHMMAGGYSGTGKTHFVGSAHLYDGNELTTGRIIPAGWPVYGLCFENKMRMVWEQNWPEQIGEKLLPFNVYIEDKKTGFIDPVKTLHLANRFIFALRNKTQGTLAIDTITFYTNLMLYAYMNLEGKVEFSEFMKPDRAITIFEYQYKGKLLHELMRMLRNYKINVIYTYHLKDKYADGSNDAFGGAKVGVIPDIQKNTDHWPEITGRLSLVDSGNVFKRNFTIVKSNYSKREVSKASTSLEAPDFGDVVNSMISRFFVNESKQTA